jgi:hypothetical protein
MALTNCSESVKAWTARTPSSVAVQPLRPLTSQPALTSFDVAVVRALKPRGTPPERSSASLASNGTWATACAISSLGATAVPADW